MNSANLHTVEWDQMIVDQRIEKSIVIYFLFFYVHVKCKTKYILHVRRWYKVGSNFNPFFLDFALICNIFHSIAM